MPSGWRRAPAYSSGRKPSEEKVEIWNAFMQVKIWNTYLSKRCWRDEYTHRLHFRLQQAGMPIGAALTMFDFVDLDEGRPLRWQNRQDSGAQATVPAPRNEIPGDSFAL
jgi:hypothetical protein